MKFVDYFCPDCRTRYEMAEPAGTRLRPRHCGRLSRRVVSAPSLVSVKREYSHAVGKEVTTRELDAELSKKGSYVPSQQEFNTIREMTENKVLPVAFGAPKTEAQLAKAADKAYGRYMKEKSQGAHRDD